MRLVRGLRPGSCALALAAMLVGGNAEAQWPHPGWRAPVRVVPAPRYEVVPVQEVRCYRERRRVKLRAGRVVVRHTRVCPR